MAPHLSFALGLVGVAALLVLEISDGKIVRFDQYVDSATINPIVGA